LWAIGRIDEAQASFEKIRPRLATLGSEELIPINIDIIAAASIALGTYERLRALRPRVVEQLPKHDLALLDELPTYAMAAWYAHAISTPPTDNGDRARRLLEEAIPLRDGLMVAAEALAHRGLLDAERVAEIRGGNGHLDRATDLVTLAALLRQNWAEVKHRTAIDRAEVERAASLGGKLLMVLGERGLADKNGSSVERRDQRARAFTLFMRAYDHCRQAGVYVRWKEDDADDFAPSLRVRSRGDKGEPPTLPSPQPPVPSS